MANREQRRREAIDQAFENALLLLLSAWTVPDPDAPGLDGEQFLAAVVDEVTAAMGRLEAKGLIESDGGAGDGG